MRTKLLAVMLTLFLLCSAGAVSVRAESDTVTQAKAMCDDILAYKMAQARVDSPQMLIDTALCDDAGGLSEFYVIALSQYGKYDFSSYEKSLKKYISSTEIPSAATREKYALALIAAGSVDSYIAEVMDNAIGQQGIMSLIYGLHLLSNGYTSAKATVDSVIAELLSMQQSDGGWAVMGSRSDVDVTAMAVQSLAPYRSDAAVSQSVDRALNLLSTCQNPDGGYTSMGQQNLESAAQVLCALSICGIDAATDPRFQKNDNTIFDAMLAYRNPDGTFSHIGNGYDENATQQALTAYVAYLRMCNGQGSLYLLDKRNPASLDKDPAAVTHKTDSSFGSYKLYAILGILAAGAVVCVLLIILKKRSYKNFLAIGVVVIAAISFVLLTNFSSTETYYQPENIAESDTTGTVTLSIRCDTVIDNDDLPYFIPDDGVILDDAVLDIAQGDTVLSLLNKAAREYQLHVETRGAQNASYVASISYLYEFDFGELSGWLYRVNGEIPSLSCSRYTLSDGDRVEWLYTREIGKDL